eukprot:945708-Prymnesium_polylepis.1
MVLLTSSSAAAVFVLSGVSPLDYSLFYGGLALLGGYGGKRLLAHLVRRYRCAALIVLILGTMIGVSMLAIAATGASNLYDKLQAGAGIDAVLGMRRICPVHGP